MTIGNAVRYRMIELCNEHNSINKLSTMSGITQSTLNNIVSGRNNITTIKKICDGLEITIIDFFNSPLFEELEQEIK